MLWENDQVLRAPLTALFRDGEDWAIFVEETGKATKRIVKIGHTASNYAEITSGLREGEQIVVYPGRGIEEGTKIAAR